MSDFYNGLAFGLVLQISVGPVCLGVLHKALTQGFRHAFAMVWGAALVDAFYILLSVAGVAALLTFPVARAVMGVAGILLLVYFGLRTLLSPAPTARQGQASESWFKSFAYGVGLTLTNPLTILFWAGVFGAMVSTHPFHQASGMLYFAAGCIAATLLFLTGVALAGHFLERVLTERLAVWLNRAVGLFLIGFAVKLAIDLFLAE
jgi:threonine/homoserine/homoserine lactone efflux protein